MSRPFGLILVAAVLAGAGVAVYNQFIYERLQPFPLSWNHDPDELTLIQLEQERRALLAKLASAQRIGSIGGVHLPLETTIDHQEALKRELAVLDEQIARLGAAIAARKRRTP